MKFVTYNIQYAKGKDERFDLGRIAETVRGADIIALQEVERFWPRSGKVDQPAELGKHLSEYFWVYGPGFDVDASEERGGTILNRRHQLGTMILSRWPIVWSRTHTLPKWVLIEESGSDKTALESVIGTDKGPLSVWSIHLTYASSDERCFQVEYLLDIHRRAQENGGAWTGKKSDSDWTLSEASLPPTPLHTIWMGDFNCEPDSPEYNAIVGTKDPLYGRVAYSHRFVDAWIAAGNDEKGRVTCPPNKEGEFPPLCLDYCFVSAELNGKISKSWIDEKAQGSDHQPVLVEIDF